MRQEKKTIVIIELVSEYDSLPFISYSNINRLSFGICLYICIFMLLFTYIWLADLMSLFVVCFLRARSPNSFIPSTFKVKRQKEKRGNTDEQEQADRKNYRLL